MGQSTTPGKASKPAKPVKPVKPAKPYADFPLFPHATRRWAKKIKGQTIYFGPWDDPDAALTLYLEEKDEWYAGRNPRLHCRGDGLTVRDLLNRFLASKEDAVAAGEITSRSFQEYRPICSRVARSFGLTRKVTDLMPEDFAALKRDIGKSLSPASLKVGMTRVRTIFRFAFESGLIDRPVRYGPGFKTPSRKVIARSRRAIGSKMLPASEIRLLLANASRSLKPMFLLGINCGFGNNDCATLTLDSLDMDGGWHHHARPKTEIQRRGPLWVETVAAIQGAIDSQPSPKDPAHKNLVFLMRSGQPWIRPRVGSATWQDSIMEATRRLLVKLSIKRPGVGFYALRHTFQTIADEVRDPVAVRFLMGHAPPSNDMSDIYRERIGDERLITVTDHVRKWLFGNDGGE